MPKEETATARKYILLDTNILQYLNKPAIAKPLLDYIDELSSADYTFAISQFTVYELLAGIPRSKEKDAIAILAPTPKFDVNSDVLLIAAKLATVYRMEKAEFAHISDGDKIIAATSVLNGAPVLTANGNDFPRPVFLEAHRKLIFYKEKNQDRMMVIYLLHPDFDFIQARYDKRP